jgi:hypothetical protein
MGSLMLWIGDPNYDQIWQMAKRGSLAIRNYIHYGTYMAMYMDNKLLAIWSNKNAPI